MAKFGVIALAIALGGAAVAAAAETPITLETDTRIVDVATARATVLLRGAVASGRADEEVVIEMKECGAPSWVVTRREHTDARGQWHSSFSPVQRTSYRARWKDSVAGPVEILARPGVRLDQRGNRWSAYTIAARFFRGAKGRLERFDRARGRWVLVKRVTLQRQSAPPGAGMAFSGVDFRATVRKGALVRFVLPRDQVGPCYLAGYSIQFNVR